MITALYQFDGSTNDLSGYYTGVAAGVVPPTTYVSRGYINQALSFNSTHLQCVTIPAIDLSRKSFTIETWIYTQGNPTVTEYGIFSQCDTSNLCISLSLRNLHITFSVDSMNSNNSTLTGASAIVVTSWAHIAVVYDATVYQQLIYVNGKIDAVSSGIVQPYQGTLTGATSNIALSSSSGYGTTYFNG